MGLNWKGGREDEARDMGRSLDFIFIYTGKSLEDSRQGMNECVCVCVKATAMFPSHHGISPYSCHESPSVAASGRKKQPRVERMLCLLLSTSS